MSEQYHLFDTSKAFNFKFILTEMSMNSVREKIYMCAVDIYSIIHYKRAVTETLIESSICKSSSSEYD